MRFLKDSQILTSNYPYYRYSLEYALNSLERIGAENIEFYACYPHFYLEDRNLSSDLHRLKKELTDRKLHVKCFTPEQCLYPVNIAAKDPERRRKSVDLFRKAIRCTAELEGQYVVLLAGYGTLDEEETETWKRSVESVAELSQFAREYGITLVLETSPREYTTTHNSKDVVRMIREVGSEAIKGMIDTATLGFSGETMRQAIDDLEGNLRHVHVADGRPNGHLILGEGTLPLGQMMSELDQCGYGGALSLEILNDKYVRNPHRAMEISYQTLKKYINL